MTDTLQLRFEEGNLCVSKTCLDIPDFSVVSTVVAALQGCWNIQKFTESRWHTVGTSARGVVVGIVTGLSSLVDYILEEKQGSAFYLSGFHRLQDDAKSFLFCCALVSRVSDAVMAELLADGRVLQTIDTLKDVLADEMDCLAQVPSFVYEQLAKYCPLSASDLRAKALNAAHVNAAFLHDRVFSVTEEYPFRLAKGSDTQLAENLESLRASAQPKEQVASQMWELLHMGYSSKKLLGVLQLIRDLEWSTLTAEQAHASAASLAKFHPEYGVETLAARALVVSVNRMMPSKTNVEKELDMHRKHLGRLMDRNPNMITGRQVYVRDLMAVAKRRFGTGVERPAGLSQRIIKGASKVFDAAPVGLKRRYEAEAIGVAARKRQERQSEIDHLRAAIDLASSRAAEESGAKGSVSWRDCAWSDREFEFFELYADDPSFKGLRLDARRSGALETPEPIRPHELLSLSEFVVWERERPEAPKWVECIAERREYFTQCALVFDVAGERKFFRFVFARKSPRQVFLSRLDPMDIDPPHPWTSPEEAWRRFNERAVKHRFTWCPLDTMDAALLGNVPLEDVEVIMDLEHVGAGILESTMELPMRLKELVDLLPSAKETKEEGGQAQGSSSSKKSKSNKDVLLAKFPWLEKYWDVGKGGLGTDAKDKGKKDRLGKHSRADGDTRVMDDEEKEAMWAEVLRYRADLATDRASLESIQDFLSTCLGGPWTKVHKGVDADAIRGYAMSKTAIEFCEARGMFQSRRCEISLYTFDHASSFTRAWCHRMQYFLNLALEVGDYSCVFTPEQLSAYEEPIDFTRAALVLDHKPLCKRAARQIRQLFL